MPAPPTKRSSAKSRTADALRGAILRGEHPPGAHLPPERALAERLGISRLTLRGALATLESEGLVEPVQGSGTRVLDYRQWGGLELLGPLLGLAVRGGALPGGLLRQLLELRRALAIEALGLASERADATDRARLGAALETLRASTDRADAFMLADLAFARAVVESTHNLPLALLFNGIARSLRSQDDALVLFVAPNPDAVLAVYARLIGAIEAHNPERARRLTRRLLERHDRALLSLLEGGAAASALRGPR